MRAETQRKGDVEKESGGRQGSAGWSEDGMDRLGGLSGTPRHRILTGRIRARTRDRQMMLFGQGMTPTQGAGAFTGIRHESLLILYSRRSLCSLRLFSTALFTFRVRVSPDALVGKESSCQKTPVQNFSGMNQDKRHSVSNVHEWTVHRPV